MTEITLCERTNCNEPVMLTGFGRPMKVCKQHHQENMAAKRAVKTAAREAQARKMAAAEADTAEPPPATAPAAGALAAPVENALHEVAAHIPATLEQIVRDALASHPDAVRLNVTGLKIAFSGEIEITP